MAVAVVIVVQVEAEAVFVTRTRRGSATGAPLAGSLTKNMATLGQDSALERLVRRNCLITSNPNKVD